MKKHCTKAKTNRILNKLGMTYVELLCALSLLMLIVVMFTPMLLSSYETLYKAGERVEDAYSSKEEIEDTLATRLEENLLTFSDFKLEDNAAKALYNVEITGKKIVSSLTQGLETAFGVARARVNIVSPSIVYDDQDYHNVIIQVKGLDYNNVTFGKYAEGSTLMQNGNPQKGTIHIEVIVPEKKDVASEANAYTSAGLATVEVKTGMKDKEIVYGDPAKVEFSHTKDNGRIYLKISSGSATPLDFTQSPVRIRVYYVDNREKIKYTSAYLTIEPPTMIFAGETSDSVDYYTSAGVVEKNGVYKLEVNPRKMRLDNSGYLTEGTDNPGKVKTAINTITWVDSDTNSNLQPYYVMAGTNSRVYRMYNYNVGGSLSGVFPQNKSGTLDSLDTTDSAVVLSDGTVATQSFWSGELSDQFYFRTENNANGYGTEADNKNDCSEDTQYDAFGKELRYLMAYSGFRTGYSYRMQASRRISYILTEAGAYSFRFAGKKSSPDEYSGYTAAWEPEIDGVKEYYMGPGDTQTQYTKWDKNKWDVDPGTLDSRNIAGTLGSPYEKPIYFSNKDGIFTASNNRHYERNIAWLGAISYTSVNIFGLTEGSELYNKMFGDTDDDGNMGFFFANKGDDGDYGGNGGTIPNYLQSEVSTNINVTSATYLPGAGSNGKGQVIYLGTVPAYTLVRQSSDIGKPDRYVYNGVNIRDSRCTLYYIFDFDSSGTIITRYASPSINNTGAVSDALKKQTRNSLWGRENDSAGLATAVGSAQELFTKPNEDKTYYYWDTDLKFTFGYCSRWRMSVGTVTSDGADEAYKSYEKYYTASNPNANYDRVPDGGLNTGSTDNLYYNVWFPGEHYNLTQTATLDEITIACGYAVSGSSFMRESGAITDGNLEAPGFYGTSLGSVYNDGVLAAYISEESGGTVYRNGEKSPTSGKTINLAGKGEQNVIFQNVLYYKSPKFLNATLHSRENIRFTAVDLISFTNADGSKVYQAVFGDNHGRLYFADVATSTVKNESGNEGDGEETVTLKTVTYSDVVELTYDDANKYSLVGGNSFSTIFSEITSIEASEDMVIVTGPAKDGGIEQFAVFERPDSSKNEWTIKRIFNGTFKGIVNNATILGDYYYICGDEWVAAVSLDTLKRTDAGTAIANKTEDLSAPASVTGVSTNKDHLLWVSTATNIYAVDGRDTKG